jgi:nucleoside-diphosphate-sugar epimerase
MDKMSKHILITGGAGYIGSMLTSELLRLGYKVTCVDTLLFGGDSLVPFLAHPNFRFKRIDVWEPRAISVAVGSEWETPYAVVHLAGIVGFPACQAVGRQVAWRYNVEAVQRVYEQCDDMGIARMIFSSTYSIYGMAEDDAPVTESSTLNPQSLYAETKIEAERFLLGEADSGTAPLVFRFATLYGLSPRTRFDLIVNQFVLEAFTKRELLIYQRGYHRSFVHIRDTVRGIIMGLEAPEEKVRGQVYNLGSQNGNYSKDDIVGLVLKRLPETRVRYKNLTFGGDMRDIRVTFEKINQELGFETQLTVDDGIREVLDALQMGLIREPSNQKYRNAQFIVQ